MLLESNGRRNCAGSNEMKDAGATFSDPSAVADALRVSGSVTPAQWPVSTRLISAFSAATVSAGAELELRSQREQERSIDLRDPAVLVRFLPVEVGRRGLGGGGVEPAGQVAQGARQGEAGATGRGLLGCGNQTFGVVQVCPRVGDVRDLQPGAAGQQLLEGELRVEGLVPRAYAAREHAAHRERGGESARRLLQQLSGDYSAERVAPGDGASRGAEGVYEEVQ